MIGGSHNITIKMLDGKTYTPTVEDTDTIRQVKEKIQED